MAAGKDQPTERRIIIDEEYKAQVQAEKEAAVPPKQPESRKLPPPPEASFSLLLASFATNALVALGVVPHPATDKTEADLDQAKHIIDTLGILEEKTKGNLTPEEKRYLDAVLFDLRLQYVEVSSKQDAKKQ